MKLSELITAENGRITRSELSARLQYDGSYLNNIVKKYSFGITAPYRNLNAL